MRSTITSQKKRLILVIDQVAQRKTIFASDCWLHNAEHFPHPLNERLLKIFDTTLLSADGQDKHDYVTRSVKADKAMGASYFSQPTEMMARAFEAVVESCSGIETLIWFPAQLRRTPLSSIQTLLIAKSFTRHCKLISDRLVRH